MIYVIGIGPGDPSYGLLGQEAYFEKADRIFRQQRHLNFATDLWDGAWST